MRSASRAAARVAGAVALAGPDHPATAAYLQARAWAKKTRQAVRAGDDAEAARYAEHARANARAARALLGSKAGAPAAPDPVDPRLAWAAGPEAESDLSAPAGWAQEEPAGVFAPPEHVRAADMLAQATGQGPRAVFLPREDGGQCVAWGEQGFAGSATVYPTAPGDEDLPHARVVFSSLDRDRYQALAQSPWPYRTEHGRVVYDRVPADQAVQIIEAARTGQPGRPWERHGMVGGGTRRELPEVHAAGLEGESEVWAEQLHVAERAWVQEYTGSSYAEINKHLFEGRALSEEFGDSGRPMSEVVTAIDSALAKAPRSPHPRVTYRGFSPPFDVREQDRVVDWVHANFQVGQTYRDDSYVSTSHCPRVAAGFSGTKWRRNGKSGHASHKVVFEVLSSHGAALASVSGMRNIERERLMPRGSSFRVVGIHPETTVAGERAVLVQMVDVRDFPRM